MRSLCLFIVMAVYSVVLIAASFVVFSAVTSDTSNFRLLANSDLSARVHQVIYNLKNPVMYQPAAPLHLSFDNSFDVSSEITSAFSAYASLLPGFDYNSGYDSNKSISNEQTHATLN